jgi:hypothetical protein
MFKKILNWLKPKTRYEKMLIEAKKELLTRKIKALKAMPGIKKYRAGTTRPKLFYLGETTTEEYGEAFNRGMNALDNMNRVLNEGDTDENNGHMVWDGTSMRVVNFSEKSIKSEIDEMIREVNK